MIERTMSRQSITSRAGAFIKRHPKLTKTALGFAALGTFTLPPMLLADAGVGEDTQEQISFYCAIGVDEHGNAASSLPQGPYGGALDLFIADEALYYDWLLFQGKMRYVSEQGIEIDAIPDTDPAFTHYYEQTFLPQRQVYAPEDVYDYMRDQAGYRPTGISALSEVPVYHQVHDAFKSKILDIAPTLNESSAHGYAHAAVGNMLLLMRAGAIILPQIARKMRGDKNDDHWAGKVDGVCPEPQLSNEELEHLACAMAEAGITPEELEAIATCGHERDTKTLMDRIQSLAEGKAGKVMGALGWVAIAASIAPGLGMGASYYAGMAGADAAIPHIVEVTGMAGHENDLDFGAQAGGAMAFVITQANTHLATCVMPALSAAALGMMGKKRKRDRDEVGKDSGRSA